jgi:hypothetical protein
VVKLSIKRKAQMKLLTKELEKKLIKEAKNKEVSPQVHAKFFDPTGSWTWFASEYDPESGYFYGLVVGHEAGLGYFSLAELEEIVLPMGLKIERDLYFESASLLDLMKENR